MPPAPPSQQSPSLLLLGTTVIYLFKSVNLHWHSIITQSPQFTLRLTHPVVHSVGFNKHIMTCIYYYNTIQSGFTALKPPWVLPVHLHFPCNTWQPRMFLCVHSFAFSRMSHSWNRTSVAFSGWLLSLQNTHLHFLRVFSRLDSSCLLRIE